MRKRSPAIAVVAACVAAVAGWRVGVKEPDARRTGPRRLGRRLRRPDRQRIQGRSGRRRRISRQPRSDRAPVQRRRAGAAVPRVSAVGWPVRCRRAEEDRRPRGPVARAVGRALRPHEPERSGERSAAAALHVAAESRRPAAFERRDEELNRSALPGSRRDGDVDLANAASGEIAGGELLPIGRDELARAARVERQRDAVPGSGTRQSSRHRAGPPARERRFYRRRRARRRRPAAAQGQSRDPERKRSTRDDPAVSPRPHDRGPRQRGRNRRRTARRRRG